MQKNYFYYKNVPEMIVYNAQQDQNGYWNNRIGQPPNMSRMQMAPSNLSQKYQQVGALRQSVSNISHRKPTVAKCKKIPDVFKDPVNNEGYSMPLSAEAGLYAY